MRALYFVYVGLLIFSTACSNDGLSEALVANEPKPAKEFTVNSPIFEAEFTTQPQTPLKAFYGTYEILEQNGIPVTAQPAVGAPCSTLAYIGNSRIKTTTTVLDDLGTLTIARVVRANQPVDAQSGKILVADEFNFSPGAIAFPGLSGKGCYYVSTLFLKDVGTWQTSSDSVQFSIKEMLTVKTHEGNTKQEDHDYEISFEALPDGKIKVSINQPNSWIQSLVLKKK